MVRKLINKFENTRENVCKVTKLWLGKIS